MATERTITIETSYVERTGLYIAMARARTMDGYVTGAIVVSAPATARPNKAHMVGWEEWQDARELATHDTPSLAVQALAAWIVGELTP